MKRKGEPCYINIRDDCNTKFKKIHHTIAAILELTCRNVEIIFSELGEHSSAYNYSPLFHEEYRAIIYLCRNHSDLILQLLRQNLICGVHTLAQIIQSGSDIFGK